MDRDLSTIPGWSSPIQPGLEFHLWTERFGSSLVLCHGTRWKNALKCLGESWIFIHSELWIIHECSVVSSNVDVLHTHKYQHHHRAHSTGNFPYGKVVFGEGQQHRAHPGWRCWRGLLAAPWKGRKQQDFWWNRGHTHPLGKGFTMDCWICPQLTKEDNSLWGWSPDLVIKRSKRKTLTWNFTYFKWINKRNDRAALKSWSGNSWPQPAPGLVAFQISTSDCHWGAQDSFLYSDQWQRRHWACGGKLDFPKIIWNYLEFWKPESHCLWVGTGQLTALHELLNAFGSCFCPSFHQTTLRFKDRCLRGHFEGEMKLFFTQEPVFYSPSRKPLNFITKKKKK